jgi:CubicO group peptidase (beta-lactamase class C family)
MIRTALAAPMFFGALLLTAPASAQSQQEHLDARYDRALAAGYKALMLCSAIAHAEAEFAERSASSVHDWELTGVDPAFDQLILQLSYAIIRLDDGTIKHVTVDWTPDAFPRIASHHPGAGCQLQPIGVQPPPDDALKIRNDDGTLSAVFFRPAEVPREEISWSKDARLSGSLGRALDGTYGQGSRTTAVVVHHDGVESADYRQGFSPLIPQRTWSVAKSIAATLIGAAALRGEADVTASAGLGAGEIDPRRAITIDHLLRMASGSYSDTPGNRTDPLYWGGATVEEVALDWPLVAAPGSSYRYANNDTLAAVSAIKPTFAAHPPAEFFAKLGMNATVAETDWQGNYILSSQVWTTANDLAKFGQLYLNDGKLPDGTRILPEGWVNYVATPSGPQPEGPFGYGAGFWLMNKSDGVPPDTFAAFGNRGQYVVIVPSRNVVIVRRGEDPVGSSFDIAAFTRDVLAALESQ